MNVAIHYMQVGPGGICFVHGPFASQECPHFTNDIDSSCMTDPQKPEYLAMGQQVGYQQEEIRRLAVVAVTELFSADMHGLRTLWNKHLPERDLEQLANLLGYSFD